MMYSSSAGLLCREINRHHGVIHAQKKAPSLLVYRQIVLSREEVVAVQSSYNILIMHSCCRGGGGDDVYLHMYICTGRRPRTRANGTRRATTQGHSDIVTYLSRWGDDVRATRPAR